MYGLRIYSTGRDRCPLSGAQRRPLGCFSEVCNALAEQYFQSSFVRSTEVVRFSEGPL